MPNVTPSAPCRRALKVAIDTVMSEIDIFTSSTKNFKLLGPDEEVEEQCVRWRHRALVCGYGDVGVARILRAQTTCYQGVSLYSRSADETWRHVQSIPEHNKNVDLITAAHIDALSCRTGRVQKGQLHLGQQPVGVTSPLQHVFIQFIMDFIAQLMRQSRARKRQLHLGVVFTDGISMPSGLPRLRFKSGRRQEKMAERLWGDFFLNASPQFRR